MADISLHAQGLTKRFDQLTAVDDLTLQVYDGEVFGFLGPNGAGKTTAISIMCGLLRADAGTTTIYGEPLTPQSRARVGVCPQSIVLWPRLTCLEQLEFMGEMYELPRKLARTRGEELLEALGLSGKRHALARTLSGGMQRRLSILLALIHDPDIVVLDEPEAGLDPQSRVLVRDYIAHLARELHKTVILTTHNMDEAERVVDRVAIIDHGRLLQLDTPENLKQRVGSGDSLHVALSGRSPERDAMLRVAFPGATFVDSSFTVRDLAVVQRLPAILAQLADIGVTPEKIDLRESTLEDVFITLTGRSLRE